MRALVILLLVAGCAGRPLGTDDGGAADLALVDLAKPMSKWPVGVSCGNSLCDTTGGKVCCEGRDICTSDPCPNPGTQRTGCDGPEDCSGTNVCCLYVDPFFGSACAQSCDSDSQRGVICHTADDCKPGQMCVQLEISGGLKGCYPQTP